MIYLLKDCAYQYLFHWLVFMIGGLRLISNNEDSPIKITFPMKNPQPMHFETLEIIQDRYKYISNPEEENETVVFHKGESLITVDRVDSQNYLFLRDLFNTRVQPSIHLKPRRLYISREDSVSSNPDNKGKIMRRILNENEFKENLKSLGFEWIILSQYSFKDKIRLFQESEIVISAHGSGLVFCLFADPSCKIVEILPPHIQAHDHYLNICKVVKVPYYRYSNVIVRGTISLHKPWNMILNPKHFVDYIRNLLPQ